MYKKLLISILFIAITNAIYSQSVDSVVIKYVNMWIDTPISIPCDEFGTVFFRDAKKVVVKDKVRIKELTDAINQLPCDTVIKRNCTDTRVKMYIYQSGNITEVCIGLDVDINSKRYLYTYELWRFLSRYIPRDLLMNPPVYPHLLNKNND